MEDQNEQNDSLVEMANSGAAIEKALEVKRQSIEGIKLKLFRFRPLVEMTASSRELGLGVNDGAQPR